MTSILGISAFYHDSAAAILVDGKIIAAAQEERFTRKKHDSSYPFNAIKFVLKYSRLKLSEIDYIVFYEKPFLKFERLLETYVALAPKGFIQFAKAMPSWLREKLFQKKIIIDSLKKIEKNFNDEKKIYFSEHHLSHAASAFYPSPFDEAIVLTADGVGEWATTTVAIGNKNDLQIKKEIHFPHSLGLLYSAFTYYTGFKVNSGEYKLMGLAPYGEPKYADKIKENLIDIKSDGSFRLNQKYFKYATGLKMINNKFENLFEKKARNPTKEKIEQFHMDIAASIQKITEDVILKICRSVKEEYKIENLCLAGGVALNCVANGKILKEKIFKNIWIQPAAGDAGGSLGAALAYWYHELNNKRVPSDNSMKGSYLGPSYKDDEIENDLKKLNAKFIKLDESNLVKIVAKKLSENNTVGWFQGKMEFGPRALGARSILADPRSDKMQKELNLKIKFRESFRPFAPSVLFDEMQNWFDIQCKSPYMSFVANITDGKINKDLKIRSKGVDQINEIRSKIPSVTHVDNSARIQSVHKETNKVFYDLIYEFFKLSKCPILVNTSFNIRGEPIVNSINDAYKCFMGTEMDYLICGKFLLEKNNQNKTLKKDYRKEFKLD